MVFNRVGGSNWGIIASIVVFAIVASSLLFLIRDLSAVDAAFSDAAADASVKYQGEAQAFIEESCFTPSGLREEDCAAKAREVARESQRKEQDLAAQNITAWWTKVMGIAALFGMAISALGIWLVKTTFDETRRSNEIARESLVTSNRAWLRVTADTDIRIKFYNDSIDARAFFNVENIGKSVAKEVKMFAIFQIIGGGDIVGFGKHQLPNPIYTSDRNGLSIWPGKDHNFVRQVSGASPALVGISTGSFHVLMKAVVQYKTIYDTPDDEFRITEAIYQLIPAHHAKFGEHNIPTQLGSVNMVNCNLELISAGGWRIS